MNKITPLIMTGLLLAILSFSCRDYDSEYTKDSTDNSRKRYAGTMYDYLTEGDPLLEVRYDSMLKVIHAIEGLADTLKNNHTESSFTLFAIPDESFEMALNTLNRFRMAEGLDKNVSLITLNSLFIEPFEVPDTTFRIRMEEEIEVTDTIVNYTLYDYRASMDSLICRYMFKGGFTSEKVLYEGGIISPESLKYGYLMNIEGIRLSAGGLVDVGVPVVNIYDAKGSQLANKWVHARTLHIDVQADNGIIHILLPGHEFGFDDFVPRFKAYGNEYKEEEDEY